MREKIAVISAQVLSEFFVIVTKQTKQNYSVDASKYEIKLLSYFQVIDIDFDLVVRAVSIKDLHDLSYWDSLILSAAEWYDCGILYSEDLYHGQKYGAIQCINPFI
ncbi:MAG: hypothetical protein DRI73_05470 [Bacteroidetes bacterium]|nr:MAG: hypothetical protein DRI73_05470 [Bacteroidota bacterium]